MIRFSSPVNFKRVLSWYSHARREWYRKTQKRKGIRSGCQRFNPIALTNIHACLPLRKYGNSVAGYHRAEVLAEAISHVRMSQWRNGGDCFLYIAVRAVLQICFARHGVTPCARTWRFYPMTIFCTRHASLPAFIIQNRFARCVVISRSENCEISSELNWIQPAWSRRGEVVRRIFERFARMEHWFVNPLEPIGFRTKSMVYEQFANMRTKLRAPRTISICCY